MAGTGNCIVDDIAFCILSKLPDKSLKRFSCVRKSWSRLFEYSLFIDMFRKNFGSRSHSLYDDDVCLCLYQNVDHYRVLGSAINGVYCIYNVADHTSVVLRNPATGETMAVPHSSVEYEDHFTTCVVLQGFGYDHVRDDYKIIQHVSYSIFNDFTSDYVIYEHFWEIYSLKSNSWKKFNFDIPIRRCSSGSDLYLNGVCHWWGEKDDESYLVSYNLCNEVCITTPSPIENVDEYEGDVYLVVLKEYVAMISNCKKTISFQISILFEPGVKESWIRVLDVEPLSGIDQPLGAEMNGNIYFRKKDGGIAYFDLNTGLIKETGVKVLYSRQVVIYKKNLVQLKK